MTNETLYYKLFNAKEVTLVTDTGVKVKAQFKIEATISSKESNWEVAELKVRLIDPKYKPLRFKKKSTKA